MGRAGYGAVSPHGHTVHDGVVFCLESGFGLCLGASVVRSFVTRAEIVIVLLYNAHLGI